MIYTLGTMSLISFFVICFDVSTGNYRKTLLPSGQCVSIQIHIYGTTPGIVNAINKIAQVIQFIIYLYHRYKLNKYITDVRVSNRGMVKRVPIHLTQDCYSTRGNDWLESNNIWYSDHIEL